MCYNITHCALCNLRNLFSAAKVLLFFDITKFLGKKFNIVNIFVLNLLNLIKRIFFLFV